MCSYKQVKLNGLFVQVSKERFMVTIDKEKEELFGIIFNASGQELKRKDPENRFTDIQPSTFLK